MANFFSQLKARNKLLYWTGWLCLTGALICAGMMLKNDTVVLGINAYIKPMKFFLSVAIFAWTIAWYMHYLKYRRSVLVYSIVFILVMLIELGIITWQASRGKLSHFNISSRFDGMLFAIMGIAIVTLTLWTLYISILFFVQRNFTVPIHYIWAVRLALLLFIIFSFQGYMMVRQLAHTVGSPDGGPGLPVLNWSTTYGDLRVAHFFGIHSLQIIPLLAYYVTRTKAQVFILTTLYVTLVVVVLMQAINKIPLIG